ncbi:MAG: hypothetical protein ABIT37_22975 [Luteolibacter sp.]
MKNHTLKWACALVLAVASTGQGAHAQIAPADSKSEDVHIALLAVGDRPEITLTTTVEKGSTYDKPPESELPPGQLFVKEKNAFKAFPLELNTPMEAVKHPGGTELRLFSSESEAGDPDPKKEPYAKIPLPQEKTSLTVFLLRNPTTKSWKTKPQAFPFKNDPQSFPSNTTRVINFSTAPIRVKLGEIDFYLIPQTSRIVPYPTASNGVFEYKVIARIDGQIIPVADFSQSYYTETRMNMVFYDADGKVPKQPVEHIIYMEIPQQAAPAPGEAAPR